jgi:5-formyltetrahydrofolate cyclo-ligase
MPREPKQELRERLLAARRARPAAEIDGARAAIRVQLLARAEASAWRTVAGYVPLRTEPGSAQLLDGLAAAGIRVLVPLLLPDRDLDWTQWGSADRLGVAAVSSCDAVLAPALAVSRTGARLGRGGGSYDRALARRSPAAVAIALVYTEEVLDEVPTDAWDEPVDEAVTPAGFLRLDRAGK